MLFVWKDPGKETSDVEKLNEVRLADSGLREKDLENLISKRIEQLIRTDQLMVIMQERSRQEEPDILALDESGTLFIFELKRWEGRSENVLQVLRYGQKFGRYEYDRLNWYYHLTGDNPTRRLLSRRPIKSTSNSQNPSKKTASTTGSNSWLSRMV